ncbi:hypothetical protein CgunFtcFv8_008256 [Champsocephalus gunnari]|uniref:Uncharacterized protein n=1 Tax=Champsocephalus gunnari TaxID=52237 RepID=A0AAN8D579_CHAGU|nr:hypothetical protein CgunFtcFv8_008256 [Champsocephalus gunnari]
MTHLKTSRLVPETGHKINTVGGERESGIKRGVWLSVVGLQASSVMIRLNMSCRNWLPCQESGYRRESGMRQVHVQSGVFLHSFIHKSSGEVCNTVFSRHQSPQGLSPQAGCESEGYTSFSSSDSFSALFLNTASVGKLVAAVVLSGVIAMLEATSGSSLSV